jgi:large subunit ribosomal protein L24
MQRIVKDDLVKVISGSEKGRIAKVVKVQGDKVYLENVGNRERHIRANQYSNGQGGKKDIQLPLHISNVALVTENVKGAEKTSRVGFAVKDGVKTRVAKTTGKTLAATKPTKSGKEGK